MQQQATVVTVLVFMTTLVLAGCSLVERLGPAALTEAGDGRVVLLDAGIALTFPDDWLLESPPSMDGGGLTAVLGPDQRDLVVPLVTAVPPTRHDRCVVVDIAPLVEAQLGWRTLDDVVADFERLLADDARWVDLDSEFLELPAGRAGRLSRAVDGEAASVTTYVFTRVEAWFLLECSAQTVPPPAWHTLAESFEFLPQ